MTSPGIRSGERDISDGVAQTDGVSVYVQVRARKGQLGVSLVTNETQFLKRYTPDEKILIGYDMAHFSVLNALQGTNKVYVQRVISDDTTVAGLVTNATGVGDVADRKVDGTFEFAADEDLLLMAADPGAWGNDVAVKIISYASNPVAVKEPGAFLLQIYKTSNLNTPVESFVASLRQNHLDGFNKNIFIENVLKSSFYLRAFVNPLSTAEYPYEVGKNTVDAEDNPVIGKPAALTKGNDGSVVNSGAMVRALDAIKNKDAYPVTLLLDGGYTTPAYQMALIQVAESRQDCAAILTMPFDAQNNSDYINQQLAYRNGDLELYEGKFKADTSYAAMYTPHVRLYDKFNDYTFWCSPDGIIAALASKTALNYEIWYPVAGFRRGIMSQAQDVFLRYSEGERDTLYDNGINCLRYAYGRGIAIWGQKTLQSRPSATDRLNVRLMLITVRPTVDKALENFVFEINDERTRSLAKTTIDSYMQTVKAKRGVSDYLVVCDETNNTPEDIDANRMNVYLFVKPTRSAEFLRCDTIITKTGTSFAVAAAQI